MATLYNGLPIFDVLINDEVEGMTCVSLTSRPAIQAYWTAFAEEGEKLQMSVVDEKEHKVITPICRADYPILRFANGQKFYVTFSKETIQKMAQKFLKQGYQTAINIEHMDDSYINGVELFELFIKDTEKGINPVGFEEIEEGSLFGIYKIENEAVWQAIQEGKFTSVSLEGFFDLKPQEVEVVNEGYDTLEDLLNDLLK